jgi:hypothetical protein
MQATTSREEKGINQARQMIALNMLRKHTQIETIAEVTGLAAATK